MDSISFRDLRLDAAKIRIRNDGEGDGGQPVLEGYASVFGDTYETDYWTESIEPGAFARSLAAPDWDIAFLGQHDWAQPMARLSNNTLELAEDKTGLRFVCRPNMDTSYSRDIVAAIKRGDIYGMSFGFVVVEEEIDRSGDLPHYTIKAANVFEISAVTYAAYSAAGVSARGLDADPLVDARRRSIKAETERKDATDAMLKRYAEGLAKFQAGK